MTKDNETTRTERCNNCNGLGYIGHDKCPPCGGKGVRHMPNAVLAARDAAPFNFEVTESYGLKKLGWVDTHGSRCVVRETSLAGVVASVGRTDSQALLNRDMAFALGGELVRVAMTGKLGQEICTHCAHAHPLPPNASANNTPEQLVRLQEMACGEAATDRALAEDDSAKQVADLNNRLTPYVLAEDEFGEMFATKDINDAVDHVRWVTEVVDESVEKLEAAMAAYGVDDDVSALIWEARNKLQAAIKPLG